LKDLGRTREIIESVVCSEGMELVDVEYKGSPHRSILRVYIDKPTGVTHRDCELISDQVGAILDVEDLIRGSFILEVSSPGLTRRLTKDSDYQRYVGRVVKIQTRNPIEGRRDFRGTLRGLEGTLVVIDLEDSQAVRIPLGSISKSNLDFDF
jgi:ribosome maturation factor RimP